MTKDIRIRKGLNINLKGSAELKVENAVFSNFCIIKPDDFHGITPKLLVKVGAQISAGQPLFHDKTNEEVKIVSPVSGELINIERGTKRKVLSLKIKADKENQFVTHKINQDILSKPEELKSILQTSGCWAFIKQRPYDVIARPNSTPRDIFISGFDSSPLATDVNFVLNGKEEYLQTALTALKSLTSGKIHVGVHSKTSNIFSKLKDIEIHEVSGPHPAGNVGTQINKIGPVNKGEVVWTLQAQDVAIIGELLTTGKFNAQRTIALAGSSIEKPRYFKTVIGAEVSSMIFDKGIKEASGCRVISGNVLSGNAVGAKGALGYYANAICVIPEGDEYEFFGWNKPIFNKISVSRALTFSWLFPKKKFEVNTNTNGEHRAFVMTGTFESVFPLDIFPLQILKACMYKDLDEMEALGMYEVAPEDFALTEFVCVSKQPHQKIIREGLDLMLKEIG